MESVQAQIAYSASTGASDLAACRANHILGLPTDIVVMGAGQPMRQRTGQVDCASAKLNWQRAYHGANDYAQTDFQWDAHGNLQHITGPANHKGDRLELHYVHDTATQTYPVSIVNVSYGLASSAEYDYRWGKPTLTQATKGSGLSLSHRPRYDPAHHGQTSKT